MEDPGPDPSITPAEVLTAFIDREDPAAPLTAQEAADILNIAKRTAHKHLQRAEKETVLMSKQVGGNARVWWVPYHEIQKSEYSTNNHTDEDQNDSA